MYKIVRLDGRIEVTTLGGVVVWALESDAWIVYKGRDGRPKVEKAGCLDDDALLLALAQKVDLDQDAC